MDKLGVFLLVISPFLGFFGWAIWWLATDSLNERRRTRAASCGVGSERDSGISNERSPGGHASAASR